MSREVSSGPTKVARHAAKAEAAATNPTTIWWTQGRRPGSSQERMTQHTILLDKACLWPCSSIAADHRTPLVTSAGVRQRPADYHSGLIAATHVEGSSNVLGPCLPMLHFHY